MFDWEDDWNEDDDGFDTDYDSGIFDSWSVSGGCWTCDDED